MKLLADVSGVNGRALQVQFRRGSRAHMKLRIDQVRHIIYGCSICYAMRIKIAGEM